MSATRAAASPTRRRLALVGRPRRSWMRPGGEILAAITGSCPAPATMAGHFRSGVGLSSVVRWRVGNGRPKRPVRTAPTRIDGFRAPSNDQPDTAARG